MEMELLLEEAAMEGVLTCQGCGNRIEPDCDRCGECGWVNPLVSQGFI